MRFDTSQHMKLSQQMKLAPRMIQSMEILQMPLVELEERIEQELESNVALEVVEAEADRGVVEQERKQAERDASENERELYVSEDSGRTDFERLDRYESSNPEVTDNTYSAAGIERSADYHPSSYSASRMAGERDAKMDAMAQAPAKDKSLTEQLLDQWALADVDERLRPLGELIIGFIDRDGLLSAPLETIADRAPAELGKPDPEQMERALQALQLMLEPPGIAARDRRECLLLQLDATEEANGANKDLSNARLLIEHHLEDIGQNRLPKISTKTGLSLDEIKAALDAMHGLSLAPARQLVNESPAALIPDAVVEYDEENDRYIAYLVDNRLPNLRINQEYARMVRDRSLATRDRKFIRTNLSNAQWLIDAIGQRRNTLLRVINVVVDAQREFFDFGPQALKPLPMTQVAEQLGIHVATVSRAVADKHLLTPRGIVPLRKFFIGGMQTDSGEEVSYDTIKAALKEVVDHEDKSRPLSDEALVRALKERGIEIARRTAAKYRSQLGIPSARLRKAF
jgi:RNA polymerase sigma-54 factor